MADDTFDHKVSGAGPGQTTAETCWYASYAMLMNWKGRSIDSIKDSIKKAGYDFADYYDHGLPRSDYRKVGMSLRLTGFRGRYIAELADDFVAFAQLLKNYGPIWCAFSNPGEHIVVVSGVNAKMNQIHIVNPFNHGGGLDADDQYPDPSAFKKRLNMNTEWSAQTPN
jgi:hypothetical protein